MCFVSRSRTVTAFKAFSSSILWGVAQGQVWCNSLIASANYCNKWQHSLLGLGTLLAGKVREDVPDAMIATFSVLPSAKVRTVVVDSMDKLTCYPRCPILSSSLTTVSGQEEEYLFFP